MNENLKRTTPEHELLDIGLIGLSVMGRSLALNMADHGFRVAGYNRSPEVTQKVMEEYPHPNLTPFFSLPELVSALRRPRKIMVMIQAGAPVDAVIDQLIPLLEEGDFIMDGGNSYFGDTNRRAALLKEKGLHYLGVGISGGEEGARFGPSIMPGGSCEAYEAVGPIFQTIAAKADNTPCCAYIGPDGAGHYVKMVHNGIEYADMQLIAESYLLLKYAGGFTNRELAEIYRTWNEGELHSYLIGITADIFLEADDMADGDLIDHILDSAGQKGTGRWASIEALRQGVDISMITAACNARIMSNHLERRQKASSLIAAPVITAAGDKQAFTEMVREALYISKIIAYAQGFSLLQDASCRFGWNLDLGSIASIFRAGCIIQAEFLNDITRAFLKAPDLESLIFDDFFLSRINRYQENLRKTAGLAVSSGLPVPALFNAVSYLDSFRTKAAGANLIQAQRDLFGAHTFERTDRKGIFHHEWRAGHEL
ncbi:decarboxylating NADP(+)-dependent phosphogluconate dehydrogenase [Hungatella hathewayi]|uniref:decarboxylating NADP(+)-dependent phosphogluconate dehydrogenase n=1 Tax=Hungatella hathewayi TaxID=154046 RepID=UPI00210A0AA1|nr:decarboxylating NADP(+)-dependent phosphogluconate dehydrogenase [Hungatella hathewayi]MCQ5384674.1 decarboxylating NADP(+)-dependent phosphogluconate dehydrogenase [Hungatella hathewayi]